MNNEIIYKGLKLTTDKCSYFQVVEGSINSLVEDPITSTLRLTYSPSSTPRSLSESLGISLIGTGDEVMGPMSSPKKFTHTYLTLNGLKFEKQTYDSHIVHMVIVKDSESRVSQSYSHTTFVISEKDYNNPKFTQFLFYSGNLLYLKPIGPKVKCYEIRNFPKILFGDSDITLTSDNTNVYTLRRNYNEYIIREIDYQDQFLLEVRRILEDYGVELVRINKETTLNKTSYITYQVNQTPTNYSHPRRRGYNMEEKISHHKQSIEFTLHTTDMILFHDFKTKYSNVDLLTNMTEYKTSDKYGDRWSAAVKWSNITEDFNHVYQADDNSNFAFQCQFRCELFYYEAQDYRFEFLQEIVSILDVEDNTNRELASEEHKIQIK